MENVTAQLLSDVVYAFGEYAQRVKRAAPAKSVTPTLQTTLDWLCDPRTDTTMGFISRALAYSKIFTTPKRHTDIIRLIKGGHVSVYVVHETPPADSRAAKEALYAHQYYVIRKTT